MGCRGPVGGHSRIAGHCDSSEGAGLMIKPAPKTSAGFRTLVLPSWGGDAETATSGKPDQTVFCSALGGLRDRDNGLGDLRNALNAAGFEWVTNPRERCCASILSINTGPWISRWSPSRASAAGGLSVYELSVGWNAFRRPFVIPLVGHFKGRVLRDICHLPRPGLPVDLWIIGVQQLIRRQIEYTLSRKCGSRSRSAYVAVFRWTG
jgi:hypothetical protein